MAGKIPGEFVPLDVNYSHDRAIRQAGPMGELLFIRGLAYARRMFKVTEGLIPDYDLPTVAAGIPNAKRHASALVRERLWIASRGGWRIRSFEKWNPEIDRAAQSTGGALGNHNRWHTEGRWSPDCAFCGGPHDDTEPIADPIGERSVTDAEVGSLTDRFSSQRKRREGEGETKTSGAPASFIVTPVTRGARGDVA